jgi:hypothetical protein
MTPIRLRLLAAALVMAACRAAAALAAARRAAAAAPGAGSPARSTSFPVTVTDGYGGAVRVPVR